jgi:hypothetical protein
MRKKFSMRNVNQKISDFFSLGNELRRIKKKYRETFSFEQNQKAIVLIEAFQVPSNEIAILHFLKSLNNVSKFTPVLYCMSNRTFFSRFKVRLRFYFSPMYSAGVRKIILIDPKLDPKLTTMNEADEIFKTIKTLKDFENLTVEGIAIGDIFYDHYLRKFSRHTIDLSDSNLVPEMKNFIFFTKKFKEICKSYEVRAILVSHTAYRWAIPARIGVEYDLDVYQITGESAYKISKQRPFAYTDYLDYPLMFQELSIKERQEALDAAEMRLKSRLGGEIGIDMPYSFKSAYQPSAFYADRVLSDSNKIKVLIAIHDFYDSPHPFGWNLHEDIYEWLCELKRISLGVEFEWYIKTHPEIVGEGKKIIEEFVVGAENFTIIPPETSHLQLIREGITCALTVFGTIASEYPYLGIPVINASINNPHIKYSFSISPKSRSEYLDVITNLDKIKVDIKKNEILEYYFMHNLYPIKSLLFYDYELYLEEIGGYSNSMSLAAYNLYIKSKNRIPESEIEATFSRFLKSGDQRLGRKHLTQ